MHNFAKFHLIRQQSRIAFNLLLHLYFFIVFLLCQRDMTVQSGLTKVLCLALLASLASTVIDFLIKLGIKPSMHLLEICIFSLNNFIVEPTKIMNRADQNWAHFQKIKYIPTLKIKVFKKISLQKLVSQSNILHGQCGYSEKVQL